MSPGSFRALLQRFLLVSGTDLSGLSAPGSSSRLHASASAARLLSSTLLDPSLEQDTKWGCVFSKVKGLVAQSCLTLCKLMNCSPPNSIVHGTLQARILEWGSHSLLQGIFLTQGSNPCLLHCRQILYHLSHQASPCFQ